MIANKITITAEAVITNEEYVSEIIMTGVSSLHSETIRDIAQECIDSTYGTRQHRRVAVFTDQEWQNMRRNEPEQITVRVHTF